ncbi:uncharacterized protein SPAPADRAFT_58548 [Spathaspora passalidarum NRRL Y-27907]|uniref:Uncharacterized protein n=1 Tax=Spathaspora passalidarum (strain NRRL Y-27907 / 11-Y1) TaxID=619300 RepID=G3AGI3_SPAPN|nr:uncharacterized protein SPAPADRAFT_58548 [Spathaspora passalidarum NRRL Y-27907]EGW35322.1 hypothetical protein SPAPADRAFT_58548 [Spathaspora passalidarum NRRL Y-27907]
MQYSSVVIGSALAASVLAAANNTLTITTQVTLTDYTTYCPEPTVLTITVCEEEEICSTKSIAVPVPGTITVTEPCIVETVYTTVCETTPSYGNSTSVLPTKAPATTVPPLTVTTYEGGAVKNMYGAFAGVAALAAAALM